MIPYGHQSVNKEDIAEVVKVLKSNYLTRGPKTLAFEESLAKYCGAKYAVVTNSGTSALHLAYLVAGLKEGDEVITTPNTFAATTNMLLAVGAKPVFCDIRLDTYNIDEKKIERLITKKTKAIVQVHFAGQPCEMEEIRAIAKKYKLLIIEDACHGLGARYRNSKIGNCRYSDIAVLSFHPVKSITTGEGGAAMTNNAKYYQKLLLLRSHGVKKDTEGFNTMSGLGFNYRLTDIQAALGISQLRRLDSFIIQRRKIVRWYKKELSKLNQIILPTEIKDNYSSWHLYVIRTKRASDRLPLYRYLIKNGIGANFHYRAVYSHPYYQKHGFKNLRCPLTEQYIREAITLPLYPLLKREQVKYITDKIKQYYR